MTRVYRFALATSLAALAIVLLGSLARLSPAGSGCGNDWPRCNGGWLPTLAWAPLIEYGHRIAALTVLVLATLTVLTAFKTPDASLRIRLLSTLSLAAIGLQSIIGGFAARWSAPPVVATLHLLTAMLFLGLTAFTLATAAAWRGDPAWLAELGRGPSPAADRLFAGFASVGAAIALFVVLFGASTSATGAFACATWPLCAGVEGGAIVHLGYRATALLATVATAGSALLAWRRGASPATRRLALFAVALVAIQTVLNALAGAIGDPVWISAPHLLIATMLWIAMLGIAAAAWGPRPAATSSTASMSRRAPAIPAGSASADSGSAPPAQLAGAGALAVAVTTPSLDLGFGRSSLQRGLAISADYVSLTKPGIMSLLLTTTLCAMFIAARGVPSFWLVAVTLLGGVLASGGANVLNCFIDRDIDGQMARTRNRAIAAGRVSPGAALTFGIILTIASVLVLGLLVNWTAAVLALAGNLFYVFIYTKWLKRATPYNIVIGGAAGAAPPLVGWAAVTGDLSPLAWGLFAVVFAWTPPHFWALALLKQGDYTRASVPMLPVVRGEAETRRQIVIYTVVLVLVCLALTPLGLGGIYLGAAIVLNGIFLWLALRLYRHPSKRLARQTFFYSLWYLALIFAAAVVDRILIF